MIIKDYIYCRVEQLTTPRGLGHWPENPKAYMSRLTPKINAWLNQLEPLRQANSMLATDPLGAWKELKA